MQRRVAASVGRGDRARCDKPALYIASFFQCKVERRIVGIVCRKYIGIFCKQEFADFFIIPFDCEIERVVAVFVSRVYIVGETYEVSDLFDR